MVASSSGCLDCNIRGKNPQGRYSRGFKAKASSAVFSVENTVVSRAFSRLRALQTRASRTKGTCRRLQEGRKGREVGKLLQSKEYSSE
eukprot:IDg9051t1